MGAKMRSLNFVAASNISMEEIMDARYANKYKPVVKEITSLNLFPLPSALDECLCSERYFHALTVNHTNTEPRIRRISASMMTGFLSAALRQASTGKNASATVRRPICKLSAVIGCHTNVRLVAFSATSLLRIDQPRIHGRVPATNIALVTSFCFQFLCKMSNATTKVATRARPA